MFARSNLKKPLGAPAGKAGEAHWKQHRNDKTGAPQREALGAEDFGTVPLRGVPQRKLVVGRADDPLEAEADRIADQVMRLPAAEPSISSAPSQLNRKCAACEQEEDEATVSASSDHESRPSATAGERTSLAGDRKLADEVTRASERKLRREELTEELPDESAAEVEAEEEEYLLGEEEAPGDYGPLETDDDETVGVAMPKRDRGERGARSLELPRGGGRALDDPDRAFMDERFGCSFANVRIHADAEAAESARSLGARAYTFGRDIYFGEGRYQPETHQGRKLLAHELTHVIQQTGRPAGLVQRDEEKPKDKPAPKQPKKKIVVDLDKQTAFALEDDKVVKKLPVSSGKSGHETSTGTFSIGERDKDHKSSTYGKCVGKSGERNVGGGAGSCKKGERYEGTPMPFFQRFNGAEGFHQGPLPGHPASHGCVRLGTSDAEWLWDWAKAGTPVQVKKAPKPKPKPKAKPKK